MQRVVILSQIKMDALIHAARLSIEAMNLAHGTTDNTVARKLLMDRVHGLAHTIKDALDD